MGQGENLDGAQPHHAQGFKKLGEALPHLALGLNPALGPSIHVERPECEDLGSLYFKV